MPDLATFTPQIHEKSGEERDGLSLLEQLAERSGARCRNPYAPVLFGKRREDKISVIHRTKCKMWNCKSCGARKAQKAIAYCINHINAVGGDWFFMTITAHEYHRGAEKSYENISENWHKLRKRMREINGGHFDYFRTWEHHEDGSFHMHIITNCKLPYDMRENNAGDVKSYCRWLKDNARACGLGYMTDYQPLDNAGFAAHYVAKYMNKSTENAGDWIKGMRRYQTSQGWTKLPDLTEETDFDWQYMKNSSQLWFEYYAAKDEGFEIYLSKTGQKVSVNKAVDFFLNVKKGTVKESGKSIWEQTWFKEKIVHTEILQ